jgi:cytoskeleton protein RodZ
MSDMNEMEPMEDEMESMKEEPKVIKARGSCGALLATARNTKNLSVQDVAARLCLSVSRIEALETDDYASLPEETFTRGYIKSYAQLVYLDTDLVLSFFPTSESATGKSPKMVIEPAGPLPADRTGWPKVFIILISIAMIVYIVWFLQQEPTIQVDPTAVLNIETNIPTNIQTETIQSTLEDSSSTAEVITLTQRVTPGTVYQDAETASDLDNGQLVSTVVPAEGSLDVPADKVAGSSLTYDRNLTSLAGIFTLPSNSLEDNSFEFGASNLRVDCSSAVWLDIRDSSGDKLFYRTCKGGEVITFNIGLPAAVFVGSIDGIELELDDKAVDLLSYSNGLSYARFTLNSWSDNGLQSPVSSSPQVQ